jgi:hypothetical protein
MTSIARHGENPPSPRQLPIEPRPERPLLQKLGVGFQPPAQAEYGPDAYPSVLRRITSLFLLLALVVFLGVAVAGMIGSVILVAGFLLEQAISG